MMKSLYSGVTGMKTHNQRMDVIGNNISNVNTAAYKGSSVTFQDIYYQYKQNASTATNIKGGVNPIQIGYGVSTGTVDQIMTQSGFNYSDNVYDCALSGDGFFQVMDEAGNIYYTRNGAFEVDSAGNLVDPSGYVVLGVAGDPTGVDPSTQRISFIIPDVQDNTATATKTVVKDYEVTVSAAGYGPNGNISISLTHSKTPFATMSGTTLNVMIDLEQEFATQADFQDAINAAITAGGVNLDDSVMPLSVVFDSIPADTEATNAYNIMHLQSKETDDAGDVTTTDAYLQFVANYQGAEANNFNVNLRTSSSATQVKAKWSDNTLTITVPGKEPTTVTDPDTGEVTVEEPLFVTLDDIQMAINLAAGIVYDDNGDQVIGTGNEKKMLTVLSVTPDRDNTDETVIDDDGNVVPAGGYADDAGAIDAFNFYAAIGTQTARVSLSNGNDNFYRQAAKDMATLKLSGGRVQAAQTVADLESVFIDSSGVIYGNHAVHGTLLLGRIDVVTFDNPTGLNQAGTSYWQESLNSGDPVLKIAGQDGAGDVVSGALEMSNVDLSQEFSDMIITQRGFQANSRIITVSDTMLEELINLKR